jgi:lipopolysaccharide biosynthesis protein
MRLLRSIFSRFSRSGEIVITRLLWCLAFLHFRPHYIREVRPGGVSLAAASRVAVLVHFDRRGRFLSYVRYFVSALNRAGFAVVIASNSRRIDQESLAEILPHCAAVVHRPNVGREFGAWRDALTVIGNITRLECLVIANDSVFGPFSELEPLLQRCDFAVADVWGMTDSYFRRYHLQSYFLIFGPTALASRFFHDFWRRVRYLRHKRSVIELYEMGLTRALLRGGLRVRALFPYTQLVDAVLQRALEARPAGPALAAQLFDTLLQDADLVAPRKGARALAAEFFDMLLRAANSGIPLNPTHHFWEYLITALDFPFLKRELVEKNPTGVPLVVNWRNALRQSTDFPIEMIEEYLQTAARNRVF